MRAQGTQKERGRKGKQHRGIPSRPNQESRDGLKVISSERNYNERSLNMHLKNCVNQNLLQRGSSHQAACAATPNSYCDLERHLCFRPL